MGAFTLLLLVAIFGEIERSLKVLEIRGFLGLLKSLEGVN
jgi:hypothetical protein